ncbi:MAG: FtsH protease activity modulator HflK [Candidatus Alcyoniella australis]|nr:FtsH protease activity modulator HflK [Candidatus Alcyoniella australis]
MSTSHPTQQQPQTTDAPRRARVAKVSIAVNLLLVLGEALFGLLVGSMAMVADALHSLSDMVVSAMVLVGVRLGERRPSQAVLIENLVALLISLMILGAALRIGLMIGRPSLQVRGEWLPAAIVATFCFALINWGLARYQARAGRETGSPSLTADSRHTSMDVMTSLAVILALMGQVIGLRLDRPVAALIVVLVAGIGLDVGIGALLGLLTRSKHGAEQHRRYGFLGLVGRKLVGERLWERVAVRRRGLLACTALLVLVLWVLSGLTMVGPDQVGLRLRWGGLQGQPLQPGLHWLAPAPIERVITVEPQRVRQLEVGFRSLPQGPVSTVRLRSNYEWDSLHTAGVYQKKIDEALVLTGDENMLDVNLVVQYSLSDPAAALLGVADIERMVTAAVESALHGEVAGLNFEQALIWERRDVEQAVAARAQCRLTAMGTGLSILAVYLQDVHPPVQVVEDFREVYSALEDKEKAINDAQGYNNEKIARARGDAVRILFDSEGYRASTTMRAGGEASRFTQLAAAIRGQRRLHEYRLTLETLEAALAGRRKVIVPSHLSPGAIDLRMTEPDGQRRTR